MGKYQITHSSELMQNYLQATTMAPQKDFRAFQSSGGQTLIFSIGSDDAGSPFNVAAEVNGDRDGWQTLNLGAQFAGQPCQHFAVGQNPDGDIHVAMVLRATASGQAHDTLYMTSLVFDPKGKVATPTWTAYPYDSPDQQRPQVELAGVFVSQTTDGEYVVADVVSQPGSASGKITRYYVDRSKADDHAWHLHDIPIDLEGVGYQSVVGRKAGEQVDGVYVSGQIDGSPQILYTPFYWHLFPKKAPKSSYLKLTAAGDLVADAIATCPNPDGTSDLYATANGVLYRFASTDQANQSTAVAATQGPQLHGVSDLFAFNDGDRVVVWGHNADNVAFYTACSRDKLDSPGNWSLALPLVTGVQHVSPLINRANGANTIVAHTGDGQLKIGAKVPAKTWLWRSVMLPPADLTVPALSFNSYTTHIQVVDATNKPAAGVPVAITAASATTVYINHLQYQVGPDAVHVQTDPSGGVTIVETVPHVNGTQFSVSVVGDTDPMKSINPMDNAFKKATDLQSVGTLGLAKIVTYKNGVRQVPRSLVKPSVDPDTLQRVADMNKQCAHIYANPKQGPTAALLAAMATSTDPFPVPADAPIVDSGDLFQLLEARSEQLRRSASALGGEPLDESFWDMLVRWFEGAWEYVVKIGEAIYRCILEAVEDVVAAVRWAFDKIVEGVEDLVHFLQYLFEWDDFKRTKDVLKNVATCYLDHEVKQIGTWRTEVDDAIGKLIKSVDAWAGLPVADRPPVDRAGLGDHGSGPMSTHAKADGQNAPGGLLAHHFQGNVGRGSYTADAPSQSLPAELWQALQTALADEKQTLDAAGTKLEDLFKRAADLSVIGILEGVVAIGLDTALGSAQVVIDALLELLATLAAKFVAWLETPIHIPVISDILHAIGIPDFSLLDVLCWVVAIPVTIGYKIAQAIADDPKAPFPDNAETTFLITTTDFATLAAAFGQSPAITSESGPAVSDDGPVPMSPTTEEATFIALHCAAGAFGLVSGIVDALESMFPTSSVPTLLSGATVVSAVVGGLSRGAANFLVPRDPLTNSDGIIASRFCTGLFLYNKAFWAVAGSHQAPTDHNDYRAIGAGVDAVLVIPALAITIVHYVELSAQPAGTVRTDAILDEASYLATYVARFLYTLIVTGAFDADKEVKAGFALAMGATEWVHGALQFAEAAVEGING